MLSRSKWKSIFLVKKYKGVFYKKNSVITEFSYKRKIKIHNGRIFQSFLCSNEDFFGYKWGEFIQTRIPFEHRRSKLAKKEKVLKRRKFIRVQAQKEVWEERERKRLIFKNRKRRSKGKKKKYFKRR